jgi:hypothetical protein
MPTKLNRLFRLYSMRRESPVATPLATEDTCEESSRKKQNSRPTNKRARSKSAELGKGESQ